MTRLNVVSNDLETKAQDQDYAAEKIESAKNATQGIVTSLWFAHGPICGQTVTAVDDLESVRRATARTMKQVSDALATNLSTAADTYDSTDTENAKALNAQVRTA